MEDLSKTVGICLDHGDMRTDAVAQAMKNALLYQEPEPNPADEEPTSPTSSPADTVPSPQTVTKGGGGGGCFIAATF